MRKPLCRILRSALFLAILVLLLAFTNKVLEPKYFITNSTWPTTSTYRQFYEMEKNSVDVLFLGSSVAVNAFSPQEVYNFSGIRSYNLASEQQSVFLSYWWLKEALRFQSPQAVVLDTRFLFEEHFENPVNTTEELTRKCLDPMRWSKVKRQAVSELCAIDTAQSELSYYLTNIRFHARWSELTEHDLVLKEAQHSPLKGFGPIAEYGSPAFAPFTPSGGSDAFLDMHPVMLTYLDRMAELCRENGIALILVSLPGNAMNDGIHNTLTAYASEHAGVDYYNYCSAELFDTIGAVPPRENVVEHQNLWGAMKTSRAVASLLRDVYRVQPASDAQYESTKPYYEHILKNCELPHIAGLTEYLSALRDGQYTVFLSVREEGSSGLTEEMLSALHALGLEADLTGKNGWSYSAVISPENGVSELLQPGSEAVLRGSMRNRKTFYTVSSGGFLAGASSSIRIDDKEYSRNGNGFNIVVYDNELMKVIDSRSFNPDV